MQKGSYNIEEVKEYFLYYVFGYSQKIEPQVYRYINKPTFVKESIICSTIGIVFIF